MSRPSLAARLRAGESLVSAWCSLPSRIRAAADAVGLPAGVHSIRAPEAGRFAAAGWRLVNVVDDVTALRDAVASGHALVRPQEA